MNCSIGLVLKTKCCSKRKRTSRHFSQRQWMLFKLRSGAKVLESICETHVEQYGRRYSVNQKKCCNPLDLHTVSRHNQLKVVSAQQHDKFYPRVQNVFEGQKLCVQCYQSVCSKVSEGKSQAEMHEISTTDDAGKIINFVRTKN